MDYTFVEYNFKFLNLTNRGVPLELRSDLILLKATFSNKNLNKFWISIKIDYANLHEI